MTARELFAGASAATESVYVEDVFSTYLYTEIGATQTITNGIDLATKGGLVWLKGRSASGSLHTLYDTARGSSYILQSSSTSAQSDWGLPLTFNADGFTPPQLGASGVTYASWTFRKQAKFFDIVTYTGNGSARTISHNLGSTPGMIIVKRTDTTGNWLIYHSSLTSAAYYVQFVTPNAQASDSTVWNSTAPTSSVFSLGTHADVNASGGTYVAYLFAGSSAGGFGAAGTDSIVACGSFTTDGIGNASISIGWEPQYILYKPSSNYGNWHIEDVMRGADRSNTNELYPNSTSAETSTTIPYCYPTATGFNIEGNNASQTYIYLAIRRGPMKTPTDATKVFAPSAVNVSSGTKITTGFPVDWQVNYYRGFGANYNGINYTRLLGVSSDTTDSGRALWTTKTDAEAGFTGTLGWDNTGFSQTANLWAGIDNIYWNFRRAPSFFDVVCYTGDGVGGSGRVLPHNLTVEPEMIICKSRSSTSDWVVWHNSIATQSRVLNSTSATNGGLLVWGNTYLAVTSPSTQFAVYGYAGSPTNASGSTYVAYLFATCPGVSKVFSFTGNGSSQTIDCGFTNGARFVLIKRTDSTGDWWVYDSARGIVSSSDPALALNSTAAEVTSADAVDPASSGFIVNQESTCNINVNSATYIGLAIA